jgi:hypothetical protein
MMSEKTNSSRRNVLKLIGSGCGISALGSVSQASTGTNSNLREIVAQGQAVRDEADAKAAKVAQRIRESGGQDAELRARNYRIEAVNRAWQKYLKRQNVASVTKHQRYEFDKSSGDIGTSEVANPDTTGIDARISMITDDYTNYYAGTAFQLYFEYSTSGHTCYRESYGEDPKDGAGLRWNAEAWNYDGSTFSARTETSTHTDYSDDFNSQEAMAFDVDDEGIFDDWAAQADCNSGLDNNFTSGYSDIEEYGVYLTEDDSNSYTNNDTWIAAAYDHTWSGTRGSVTVGAGASATGPSISVGYTFTSSLENEPTTTEKDGNTLLEVYKDEASYTYNL